MRQNSDRREQSTLHADDIGSQIQDISSANRQSGL